MLAFGHCNKTPEINSFQGGKTSCGAVKEVSDHGCLAPLFWGCGEQNAVVQARGRRGLFSSWQAGEQKREPQEGTRVPIFPSRVQLPSQLTSSYEDPHLGDSTTSQ